MVNQVILDFSPESRERLTNFLAEVQLKYPRERTTLDVTKERFVVTCGDLTFERPTISYKEEKR